MGFFDDIRQIISRSQQLQLPVVKTKQPQAVADMITQGQLPSINTSTIFLKSGEICHFIDNAILMKDKIQKIHNRAGTSTSRRGFFGNKRTSSRTHTDVEEHAVTEFFNGVLYITNKRMIFHASKNGFEVPHAKLTAISPYSNAVELQYDSTNYKLLVPDGSLVNKVFVLLR